ncbi:MAG: helix-turn-helix domain-containing protein [Gammaproteobacteria bacterium]
MKLIKASINNTAELGELIRTERKDAGITLQQTSENSDVGIRFLSELERGKETAEIGKVISALHAVGLNLAIVKRANHYPIKSESLYSVQETRLTYNTKTNETLSQHLEMEFPYHWSNPDMTNTAFIHSVLAKTRFNDILRITHYFGLSRIETETMHFVDTAQYNTILKLLSHIREGIKIAQNTILNSENKS